MKKIQEKKRVEKKIHPGRAEQERVGQELAGKFVERGGFRKQDVKALAAILGAAWARGYAARWRDDRAARKRDAVVFHNQGFNDDGQPAGNVFIRRGGVVSLRASASGDVWVTLAEAEEIARAEKLPLSTS